MRKLLRQWPLTLAAMLAILCGVCVWRLWAVSNCLPSQKAAQRWQGTGERSFAQVSCYMPPTFNMKLDEIYKFRGDMAQKLKGASYDVERETGLYSDAWSTSGTVKVANGRRSGDVQVIAVGGNFFDFHPLRLVSGSYLTPNDVMDDRVLLDRETAWLLFGATDVAGLSFSLEGIPMVARPLVKDGELQLIYGANRFCQYLGIEPTGYYERIGVNNGTVALDDLRRGCLCPVSFSDFQMDAFTGHFGGEIRLAYLYTEDGVQILTGGSINGSLPEKQGNLVFSTERYDTLNYTGPFAVRIDGVEVAG